MFLRDGGSGLPLPSLGTSSSISKAVVGVVDVDIVDTGVLVEDGYEGDACIVFNLGTRRAGIDVGFCAGLDSRGCR